MNFVPEEFKEKSKEVYHRIKHRKSIINGMCTIKIAVLKHFQIFRGKHLR